MQDILVYEGVLMRCVCVCVFVFELYYVYFLFGVKCLELWWYDSAQPSG